MDCIYNCYILNKNKRQAIKNYKKTIINIKFDIFFTLSCFILTHDNNNKNINYTI